MLKEVGDAEVTMLLAGALLLSAQTQQLPRPTFETGVDIVLVDAHIVDRDGKPMADLRPEEFEVEISGRRRKVASVQFLSYGAPPAAAPSAVPPAALPPAPA
ncbi:MAG TPA: hypothetical protein VJ813_10255, partial [Vicinamibacterales bacterium]|nr:hypothetical protein [Vicinamibacterales bacterium]